MGPVGFLNLRNLKMFAKHRPEKWFFMQLQVKDQHIATTGSVILLMVQKSGDHQLRLVVYPPWFKEFYTSQVVITGFLPSKVLPPPGGETNFGEFLPSVMLGNSGPRGTWPKRFGFFDPGCFGLPIRLVTGPPKESEKWSDLCQIIFSKAPTV